MPSESPRIFRLLFRSRPNRIHFMVHFSETDAYSYPLQDTVSSEIREYTVSIPVFARQLDDLLALKTQPGTAWNRLRTITRAIKFDHAQ